MKILFTNARAYHLRVGDKVRTDTGKYVVLDVDNPTKTITLTEKRTDNLLILDLISGREVVDGEDFCYYDDQLFQVYSKNSKDINYLFSYLKDLFSRNIGKGAWSLTIESTIYYFINPRLEIINDNLVIYPDENSNIFIDSITNYYKYNLYGWGDSNISIVPMIDIPLDTLSSINLIVIDKLKYDRLYQYKWMG